MPKLQHDSLRLHYELHGAGPPVLALHGGVSSFEHNFGQCGWTEALTGAGRQVVGLDLRGHGRSDRPHDAARYGTSALAGDALAPQDAAAIDVPTLVISGQRDPVLGRGPRLAAALGRAEYLEIAGANHFALAMEPAVRQAVVRFLGAGLPAA